MRDPHERPPLVIIGYDAGDPPLMTRWALDGVLPGLRSVMDRGLWARTAGPEMVSEHGMWVTLTSGVSRGRHGYTYHRQLRPGTYDLEPMHGRDLGVLPFWSRLPEERAIAVIDVPDIAAPRPQRGMQISEWATHYPPFAASTEPPNLLGEVRRIFGEREIIDERPESTAEEDAAILTRLLDRLRRKGELCRRLVARERFDLVCVVFGESHTGGHQFWKYRLARERGEDDASLGDATQRIYRAIDEEATSIVRLLPADANVVVLGSIGMRGVFPAAGLGPAVCRELGYEARPAGRAARAVSLSPVALARMALPEGLRAQASRLLPRATQERLLSDKFRASADWERTTVFTIPSYYASTFRVNLAGREPAGIVSPGREYDALLDRLEADLRSLVDPVTGRPAVSAVDRTRDLFGPAAHAAIPDLIAEWAKASHFMESVAHPRARLSQARCEFHRGSDHSRYGFVAAAGPAIERRGDVGEVSPLDIAPSCLALLSAPPSPDLPGKAALVR